MDIPELSRRTNIGLRRLRYVVEHEIVPPQDDLRPGKGQARQFTPYVGFLMAIAAALLEMGIKRPLVVQVMEVLLEYRKRGLPPGSVLCPRIQNVFEFAKSARIEIGDGENVRLVARPESIGAPGSKQVQPLSLPWVQIRTQAFLDRRYEPMGLVALRLDSFLASLRLTD